MTEVRSIDLSGDRAPALSTTSDMPDVGTPTEPKKGAVSDEELKSGSSKTAKADDKTEPKKADDKTDDDKGGKKVAAKKDDEPKTGDDADGDKPKGDEIPAWQKREITKARNRQREAEARADALQERFDKVLTVLEKQAQRGETTVKTEAPEPRPKLADFPGEPEKYEEALIAWSARAAAKLTEAELERKSQERAAEKTKADEKEKAETQFKERAAERKKAWDDSKEQAIEKYPDFEDVAMSEDVEITPAMAFAIMEVNVDGDGIGTEVAYYLGKHPDEAAKIAKLSTNERQGLAIGRLAERLASKPVAVTKVPDAIKPLGSRSAAVKKGPADESMEEYAVRRNAELRANPH